ncbi:hypothetical protein ACQUJS_07350 [Ralstonia pseudosolanacearum]
MAHSAPDGRALAAQCRNLRWLACVESYAMRACPGQIQSLLPATPGLADIVARFTQPALDAPCTVAHVDRVNDGIDTLMRTATAEA